MKFFISQKLFAHTFQTLPAYIHTLILHLVLRLVHIHASLAQALHFERGVKVGIALGFNYHDSVFGQLYNEVRVVMGDIAVPVNIIKLEVGRKIVLGIGRHILAIFPKSGKFKFKMAVANYIESLPDLPKVPRPCAQKKRQPAQ